MEENECLHEDAELIERCYSGDKLEIVYICDDCNTKFKEIYQFIGIEEIT